MNRTDAVGARLVPRSEFGGGYERRLSATLLGILLPVARISAPEGPRAAMLPASPMLVYRSGFSRKGPGCWLVLLSIAQNGSPKRGVAVLISPGWVMIPIYLARCFAAYSLWSSDRAILLHATYSPP
jgi:hypothetical protein